MPLTVIVVHYIFFSTGKQTQCVLNYYNTVC